MTHGEVLESFEVRFSIFLTAMRCIHLGDYKLKKKKKKEKGTFSAFFSSQTCYRFNCSFELSINYTLPSAGDSITVSIQLSRESELHF